MLTVRCILINICYTYDLRLTIKTVLHFQLHSNNYDIIIYYSLFLYISLNVISVYIIKYVLINNICVTTYTCYSFNTELLLFEQQQNIKKLCKC